MMRAGVICAFLAASPVVAQDASDGSPSFDPALIETCLTAGLEGQNGSPQWDRCVGVAASACIESPGGYSTAGTSMCLYQEYDVWDARLNDAYQQVMAEAEAMDKEMADLGSAAEKQVPLLRDMQRNWITYRDAACGYERSRWGGGSGGGPASAQCMMRLTAQQFFWLQQYASGGE